MMKTEVVFLLCFMLCMPSLIISVSTKHREDPSTPDETDTDIINEYIKSRTELDNKHDNNSPEKKTEETEVTKPATDPDPTDKHIDTDTSTEATPEKDVEHKTENGETCKCVKYYLCNMGSDDETAKNGTGSSDQTGAGGDGTDLLGVVDIRKAELKNGENETAVEEESPSDCPHYFDVCCPLKNVKEVNETKEEEEPQKPPPKDTDYEHTTCGHRNENGVGFKITGATQGEAQFGEFPWSAAIIQLETNEDNLTINKYIGAGSLLHPQVVLTVAHNVHGKNRSTLKVRLGEWDTQTNDEPYPNQDRGVAKVIVHEQFLHRTLYNDIALLILDEEARIAPNVDTICLPPLNKRLKLEGQVCYSSGWGKDHFGAEGRYSEIMKKVAVPVVSREKCQKELEKSERLPGFRLDKSFMCAGGTGEDTCKGDGGSALVCSIPGKNHKHYVQVGAVSWGLGCKQKEYPGVYTDIVKLTPWILAKMDKEGMSSEYFSLSD